MLPFRLDLLGAPVLTAPDGEPVRFRTKKHLALLIYLTVEPAGPQRRDRLATLLWSRAEIEEARHSLATALSVIRGKLGPDSIDSARDIVTLNRALVVSDVSILLGDDQEARSALRVGRFLDEFEIADAPDFNQWVEAKRLRLLAPIHVLLSSRIARCRETGDSRLMERLADQLNHLDDLSEEATRARMEARAMAGDRVGALRVFDEWSRRLDDQLGASPSAELAALAGRLRRRGIDRGSASADTAQSQRRIRDRIFVGRSEEHATGRRLWNEVRSGQGPRHMLVTGESGIGKSSLVERLTAGFSLEGAVTARVRCHALERELPFGMASSIVAELLDLPGTAGTAPMHLAELARLVPKVRERFPGLPSPSDAVGESARILFTEGVLALIEAVADEQPLALIVDDIDLADATSLGVLHLMMRRMGGHPVMVLLTASDRLTEIAPEAQRFVDRPGTLPLVQVTLGPLPDDELTELLNHHLQETADPGSSIRRTLVTGSRGNPMILELMIEDWRRRGQESVALAMGAMAPGISRTTSELFGRLLDGVMGSLDPDSRAVADLAAILGHRLGDLNFYSLLDLSLAQAMRAMAALASARIMREAGGKLEFANEVVRANCYVRMTTPLRQMLHTLVADRLINQGLAAEPEGGLEIAWHLVRADRLEEAVPYLLSGGRSSIRRGAPHEADLALGTGMPALTGKDRCPAILLYAEALQELGRWQDSLAALDIPCDPMNPTEEATAAILRIIARRWQGELDHSGLVEATLDLCRISNDSIDSSTAALALSAIPYFHSQTRDTNILHTIGETLKVNSQREYDQYNLVGYLLSYAWWLYESGNRKDAIQPLIQANQIVADNGFASSRAIRVKIGIGNLMMLEGEYSTATAPLTEAYNMAIRIDNPVHVSTASVSLAVAYGRQGDTVNQLNWSDTALTHIDPSDWSVIALAATYENGTAKAITNQFTEAIYMAEKLIRRAYGCKPPWAQQMASLMAADIMALVGERGKATKYAKQAIALAPTPLLPDIMGSYARWLALITGGQNDDIHKAMAVLQELLVSSSQLHYKDKVEVQIAIDAMNAWLLGQPLPSHDLEELSMVDRNTYHMARRYGLIQDGKKGKWGLR